MAKSLKSVIDEFSKIDGVSILDIYRLKRKKYVDFRIEDYNMVVGLQQKLGVAFKSNVTYRFHHSWNLLTVSIR